MSRPATLDPAKTKKSGDQHHAIEISGPRELRRAPQKAGNGHKTKAAHHNNECAPRVAYGNVEGRVGCSKNCAQNAETNEEPRTPNLIGRRFEQRRGHKVREQLVKNKPHLRWAAAKRLLPFSSSAKPACELRNKSHGLNDDLVYLRAGARWHATLFVVFQGS